MKEVVKVRSGTEIPPVIPYYTLEDIGRVLDSYWEEEKKSATPVSVDLFQLKEYVVKNIKHK